MLEFNKKFNLLMQANYKYQLQDVKEPNLYRELYDYESIPRSRSTTASCPCRCPMRYG